MKLGDGTLAYLAAALLIIFIAPAYLNPLLNADPPPIIEPPIILPTQSYKLAITYSMTWWKYDLQQFGEASTIRDFKLFAANGIRTVVICPHWATLEPSEGQYNTAFITNLKRVCQLANAEGLRIVVDLHMMSLIGNYGTPSWIPLKDATQIITNPRYRADYLAASRTLAAALTNEPNLHSFSMINEPHLGIGSLNVDKEQFISFIQELRATYRTVTSKPLTIRFDNALINTFNLDPQLLNACDYISLNFYTQWFSEAQLRETVTASRAAGKQVWITEFGYSTTNDAAQATVYRNAVAFFRTLDITTITPWIWRADSTYSNPEPLNGGYNLAANTQGTPRPAFYAFTEYAE